MKSWKLLFQMLTLVMITVGFIACGDDDDNDGCVTCTLSYGGQTNTEELCEADAASAAEYQQAIAAIELLGGSCD